MSGLPKIETYALPTSENLPINTARWNLNPKKAALLIHDMQRYFLSPFPESIRNPLIHNCVQIRNKCEAQGIPIFYSAQPGDMTEEQRGLLADIWGPGMRAHQSERQIIDELEPRPSDHVLTKWRYSAFYRSDLLELIRAKGRDQLIICGVYAHVGILATTIEAFSHDIQPFLIADGIADFSEKHHRMAIEYSATRCAVVKAAAEIF